MWRNIIWTAVAAVALAAPAAAEPVQWSLSSTVSNENGATTLYLGTFTFQNGPADGPVTQAAFAPLPTGLNDTPFTGNVTGVRVASISKGGYTLFSAAATAQMMIAPETVFTLNLNVTDTASGQTGVATFTGMPTLNIGTDFGSAGDVSLGFQGLGQQSLTVGGRQYAIVLGTAESDSGSYLTADVLVGPTSQTPEPGTLALAGLGLAGLLGWRARRKK